MIRRPCAAASLVFLAPAARAHGFGQRYDLPLPLELYLCGAALTVIVSCVMFALYARAAPRDSRFPSFDLLATNGGRFFASSAVLAAIRLVAVLLYALVLFAGFFGNPSPFRNLVPVTIWALWWVGVAYFSALVFDVWKIANPLETIFAAVERLYARLRGGKALALDRALPARVQAWPAVVLYLVFLWMEMVWDGSDSPRALAAAVVAYSIGTWLGMWIFGRETWLAHGEVFARVFATLARFAPLEIGLADRRIARLRLRPYAVGLIESEPLDASAIALVIAILASVSFDGFLETPVWAAIAESAADDVVPWLRSAGLIAAPLFFFAAYATFARLVALSGGMTATEKRQRIPGLFVLTLVPIAIAYQFAHYLSFLVQAGQYIIPLASDPFGRGWNLFGTANYFVRIGIVDARLVWIVSVSAIVTGHVAALYLCHALSLREFPTRRSAAASQGPMLVLMVAYTMLSLWIIAQPIVGSR